MRTNKFHLKQLVMFFELLFGGAKSRKARLPQQKTKRVAPDREVAPKGFEYSQRLDKWQRKTTEATTRTYEWDFDVSAHAETATKKRSANLDKFDVAALDEKGLSVEMAMVIKPFFASETRREDAAKMIDKKGYHQGTIKAYYAAFNAAEAERQSVAVPQ